MIAMRRNYHKGMILKCPLCHNDLELEGELQDGQHVLCPYCNGKFSYDAPRIGRKPQHIPIPKRLSEDHSHDKEHAKNLNSIIARFKWWFVGVIVFLGLIVSVFAMLGHESTMQMKTKSISPNSCPISSTLLAVNLSSPEVGNGYIHLPDKASIRVEQVLENEGVIVSCGENKVFIETEREYVDGSKLSFGLYVCTGTAKFTSKNGTPKTMWVFKEADKAIASERYEQKLKEVAEEEVKRQKIAAQQEFEQKQAELKAAEEAAKAKLEIEKQRQEQELKLVALKEEQARREEAAKAKAELEKKTMKEAAEKKAEEERIKRRPQEQKQRSEYAASKLSILSFKLSDYFIMQKALTKYLYNSSVTETSWGRLREQQKAGDWLGMLGTISGETISEFPEISVIDSLLEKLLGSAFHAEFQFSYDLCLSVGTLPGAIKAYPEMKSDAKQEVVGRRRRRFVGGDRFNYRTSSDWQKGVFIVEFPFRQQDTPFVYSSGEFDECGLDKAAARKRDRKEQIDESVRLGKISADDGEREKGKVEALYWKEVRSLLATSTVSLQGRTRIITKPRQSSDSESMSNDDLRLPCSGSLSDSPDAGSAPCQKCKGKGKIKVSCTECSGSGRLVCPKCNGAKSISLEASYKPGLSGRNLSLRTKEACPTCSATGKIRCSLCKGTGRTMESCDQCAGL